MAAAATPIPIRTEEGETLQVTLLEIVGAVSEVTSDEREVVATVLHMLQTGQIALCGNFRGTPPDEFCS